MEGQEMAAGIDSKWADGIFLGWWECLKMIVVMNAKLCKFTKKSLNCTLQTGKFYGM